MNQLLLRAVQTGKLLNLIYMSNKCLISQRTVQIYTYKEDHIYAYCMKRHNIRRFNINNILAVSLNEVSKERIYDESL